MDESVKQETSPGGRTSNSPAAESTPLDGAGFVEASAPSPPASLRLGNLTAGLRDQGELERNIGRQAEELLAAQANEKDDKRLERARKEKEKLESQVRKLESRLNGEAGAGPATSRRVASELSTYQHQIDNLDRDITEIQERMLEREQSLIDGAGNQPSGNQRQPQESERQFLIRTGKITPFSKIGSDLPPTGGDNLRDLLLNAEAETGEPETLDDLATDDLSHRVLSRPGFGKSRVAPTGRHQGQKAAAKGRRRDREGSSTTTRESSAVSSSRVQRGSAENDEFAPSSSSAVGTSSKREAGFSDEDSGDDTFMHRPAVKKKRTVGKTTEADANDLDDGNEKIYQARLSSWIRRRKEARKSAAAESAEAEGEHDEEVDGTPEWRLPHPTAPGMSFEGGFSIPGDVHPSLFHYQKTGVQWLWELYSQQVGGIVGDEMGLGKTIQVIAFLAGLHHSNKITKPTIIVAPATVMKQWVNEFHVWWPAFRVSILHSSGSGMVDVGRESKYEDRLDQQLPGQTSKTNTNAKRAAKRIIDRVVEHGHVLVTTYSGLQTYADLLVPIVWEYAVLDEGHKIRNPNAAITLFCKELRTANRIILSGTPMQNNLVELWSLFDFIFPMRLGNLMDFKHQFEFPIRMGGYANASNLDITAANKCAEALKDAISPYLLQRVKADVAADLPKKTERVLFVRLTKPQREAYESFLAGEDVRSIYDGKRNVLYGVDMLRKICNHPDLANHRELATKAGYEYGKANRSGKMMIVRELLKIWKKGGHKTLLFAQHRIMLDILEAWVKKLGINYRRMDGTTPIVARQALVDTFNADPTIHVFLLTTKVGGLGVNLTGADRVIIFDPDWNPSTDIQARERAWRLGQKREVEIYRLMVAGTIEEKIFHRQLFKQFLTHKILKDPKQRQTFQMQDLHDLFSLGSPDDAQTETSRLFHGVEVTERRELSSIQDLEGVSSLRPMESGEEARTDESRDERIMSGIFPGLHSALEHDRIVNGKLKVAPNPEWVELEAKKIAAESVAALKKAEAEARTVPAGVPTWTGQFGTVGRPGAANAGGPSSASILAGLQNRNTASTGATATTPARDGAARRSAAGKDLAKQLRDFLLVHGGRAPTRMVIDHFDRLCTSRELTLQFEAVLRELATVRPGSGGRGVWTLKDEYKNP